MDTLSAHWIVCLRGSSFHPPALVDQDCILRVSTAQDGAAGTQNDENYGAIATRENVYVIGK